MSMPVITRAYLDRMTAYFALSHPEWPPDKVEDVVKKVIRSDFKDRKLKHIATVSKGNTEVQETTLFQYLKSNQDNIIVPTGSVYTPTDKQKSLSSRMVTDRLAERKVVKKKMFVARAAGDKVMENKYFYIQTTIKINNNSLPGAFGSAYNLFYDKGNYNSITGLARALIGCAYVTAENLIGGNFGWFTENDVIEHFISCSQNCPPQHVIHAACEQFRLYIPTKDDLLEFVYETVRKYILRPDKKLLENHINMLPDHLVTYVFYMGNLKHLFMWNETMARDWFDECFDIDIEDLNTSGIDVNDLYKLDEDLVPLVTSAFSDTFRGKEPYELPEKNPQLAKVLIFLAKHLETQLLTLNQLFDTFVFHKLNIQRIDQAPKMWRDVVVLSDTDSVIFTTNQWANWYTGNDLDITPESYQMAGIMIYWLTKSVAASLRKYSREHGASIELQDTMVMKNELLYPDMLTYEIKKTYGAITKVNEGVVLPEMEPDIKGVALRGSNLCTETLNLVKHTITEDILKIALNNKVSAKALIQKIIDFEQEIIASLGCGDMTYVTLTSIKNEAEYATPLSSQYFYYMAWTDIFSQTYGPARIPTKTPVIPILDPTPEYLEWLEENHPQIGKRFKSFLDRWGKAPSAIAINPAQTTFPEELKPIVDIRKIVNENIAPLYLTMERLRINVDFEKKRKDKLLFSDIYGPGIGFTK